MKIKVKKPKMRMPVQINRKAGPMKSKKKKLWEDWEYEYLLELELIDELIKEGHTKHCANDIVWGCGLCICGK